MNRTYLVLALAIVFGVSMVSYAAYEYLRPLPVAQVATSTLEAVAPPTVHPYGTVTLSLGETARFEHLTIRPLSILEDSRCPMNARCIQAGTVSVAVEVISAMGTSTGTVSLERGMTTEAESIALVGVSPEKLVGETIGTERYRLTFEVKKRSVTPVSPTGKCYIGGCSSQLCTDKPDMVSTCEYREAYACYQGATCERQASGQCGWTETPALKACLDAAQ